MLQSLLNEKVIPYLEFESIVTKAICYKHRQFKLGRIRIMDVEHRLRLMRDRSAINETQFDKYITDFTKRPESKLLAAIAEYKEFFRQRNELIK